ERAKRVMRLDAVDAHRIGEYLIVSASPHSGSHRVSTNPVRFAKNTLPAAIPQSGLIRPRGHTRHPSTPAQAAPHLSARPRIDPGSDSGLVAGRILTEHCKPERQVPPDAWGGLLDRLAVLWHTRRRAL